MRVFYILSEKSPITAMALWPFLIANKKYSAAGISAQVLNHERIHHRQQIEMLVLPFYLWYITEWLIRYLQCGDPQKAYRSISFEQEAYTQEERLNYLSKRSAFSFLKYLSLS